MYAHLAALWHDAADHDRREWAYQAIAAYPGALAQAAMACAANHGGVTATYRRPTTRPYAGPALI